MRIYYLCAKNETTVFVSIHKNKWYEREASAYGRRHFGEEWWTEKVKRANPTYGFLGYKE